MVSEINELVLREDNFLRSDVRIRFFGRLAPTRVDPTVRIATHGGLGNELVGRKRRRSRFFHRFRRFGDDPVVSDGGFLRRASDYAV